LLTVILYADGQRPFTTGITEEHRAPSRRRYNHAVVTDRRDFESPHVATWKAIPVPALLGAGLLATHVKFGLTAARFLSRHSLSPTGLIVTIEPGFSRQETWEW